ncbi:type II toxin-antitoxin system HicA family toxin [Kangiella sp.]|uniref:type II toxin-antitoxin system HicA family toxin n=1 Tax=Kangiella sp. TaxID=1920245 RepID=UPI0019CB387F|nr:type II toxin-antitoxin system HicA family toxin [Kangiella sp.]MBD3653970.1 type II toxin-antitoxin system HicA family toxin [Kangiella sp.]MCW9028657.1 type II toxin-antitoxin system HicA family toxin [Kangiella sp.]
MKSGDLINLIEKAGWELVRVKGSHHHFKHKDYPELLTIPHPKKDIPKGTLRNILKVARL